MKIDTNINKIFETINTMNGKSSDIVTRLIEKKNYRVGYIF